MRKIFVGLVALSMLAFLAPGAAAADTGSQNYTVGGGARVAHGVSQVPFTGAALTVCAIPAEEQAWTVCVGGGIIPTSECLGIRQAAGDCAEEATRYLMARMTTLDGAFGNNIFSSLCIVNPDPANQICDQGQTDGIVDAQASGCGIELIADANPIPGHIGNFQATGFAYVLGADPSTNEVCVASTGNMNVVFE